MVLPDLANAAQAIAARGGDLGKPLYLLATTSSTSDEARRAAKLGAPHGSTWVAEEQTAGRGRQGRVWTGRRGESLLFSVLVRTRCPPARLPQLALVAGLAVRDAAARALPGVEVRIKWPNDVVVGTRKLAGILVESTLAGREVEALVVGVGVNVHTREFPDEIAERATSIGVLRSSGGGSPCPPPPLLRSEMLADILEGLSRDLVLVAARGLGIVHARLVAADALRGARVASESRVGHAEGIDTEGRLVVRTDDGTLARWSAGEVHLA